MPIGKQLLPQPPKTRYLRTSDRAAQAQKFGAQIMIAKGASRLLCDRKPYAISIGDGERVAARAVVIATGAEYRRLNVENFAQFEGAGVYYGATFVKRSCAAAKR